MVEDQNLKKYFKFDETDQGANRKGRLSEKQLKRLKVDTIFEQDPISRGLGILFFFIAIVGMVGGLTFALDTPITSGQIIFGLIFGLFWPFIWGGIGIWMIRPSKKKKLRVKVERGRIRIVKHEAPDSIPYYELHVGKLQFDMDDDPTGVVMQKGMYAVYYLDKSKEILSVEHVSNVK
jgi:hypothetical protein